MSVENTLLKALPGGLGLSKKSLHLPLGALFLWDALCYVRIV